MVASYEWVETRIFGRHFHQKRQELSRVPLALLKSKKALTEDRIMPRSRRAPLDTREQAFALSLSYTPGKVPPLPPERALKVVKRAVKLRTRRAELRRAKAKRHPRVRAAARVAATSRGRNR